MPDVDDESGSGEDVPVIEHHEGTLELSGAGNGAEPEPEDET